MTKPDKKQSKRVLRTKRCIVRTQQPYKKWHVDIIPTGSRSRPQGFVFPPSAEPYDTLTDNASIGQIPMAPSSLQARQCSVTAHLSFREKWMVIHISSYPVSLTITSRRACVSLRASLLSPVWKHRLTAAEEELLVSFLDTAAWYIARRSFTDTDSPSCSSSGRPGLPAAAQTQRNDRYLSNKSSHK